MCINNPNLQLIPNIFYIFPELFLYELNEIPLYAPFILDEIQRNPFLFFNFSISKFTLRIYYISY
jgi:hypothetical protein